MQSPQKVWLVIWVAVTACKGGGGQKTHYEDKGAKPEVTLVDLKDTFREEERESGEEEGPVSTFEVSEESEVTEERLEGERESECVPNCEGKECGDDGCGGICGYCPYGYLCKVGVCVEYCVPNCTGKQCGDDGCGGLCGDCAENEYCAEDFTCVLKGCVPDCTSKECGPDGCGGSCGKCGEGQVCDPKSFECVKDTSCHEVTEEGRCVGNLLQWCEGGVLQEKYCDPSVPLVCGYNFIAKKYECMPPEQCKPQCEDRECGDDGCQGSCGDCPEGQVCSTSGKCGQPCGNITEVGICEGDILRFCHQGILISYDCGAEGKHCKWDPTGNSGKGWYDCL